MWRKMHLISALMLSTLVQLSIVGNVQGWNGGVQYMTSPNYPNDYPDDQNISQTMSVENGASISVTFHDFQLESHSRCSYDFVKICDGKGKCRDKMCGSNLPQDFIIDTSTATVLFHSDHSYRRTGFKLSYQAVCQRKIYLNNANIGTLIQIASPGYAEGRNYPNNVNCSWTLIAPPGEKVSLTMLSIDTEFGYDIIKVYDGEKVKDKVLAIMSGTSGQNNNRNKDIIVSSGEVMKVTFSSDIDKNMAGFKAAVSAIIKTDLPIFSWADESELKFNIAFPNGKETRNEIIQLRKVPDMDPACIFEGSTTNTHVVMASSSSSRNCHSLDQHVEIMVNSTFLTQENAKYSIQDGQLKETTEIVFENNVLIRQNKGNRRKRYIKKHAPAKIEIWIRVAFDRSLKNEFSHYLGGVNQIKQVIKKLFSIAQDFFQNLDAATSIKLLLSEIIFIDETLQVTDDSLKQIRKYQKDPTSPLIVICADDASSDIKGLSFRSGVCRENDEAYGVALIAYRENTLLAGDVMAHELLHLFGMEHDEKGHMDRNRIDSWYADLGHRCYDKSCTHPLNLTHGTWDCDAENKICSIKCDVGFTSVFSTIECQNGIWSETINDVACTPSVFFVVGGKHFSRNFPSHEIYHPIIGNPECTNPLPTPPHDWRAHTMFNYRDNIYICGGGNTPSICISINSQRNKWETHRLPSSRGYHSTVVFKNTVYFIGGTWNTGISIPMPMLASLPLAKNPELTPIPNLNYQGHGQCVVKIDEDSFVIIGGEYLHVDDYANVTKYNILDKLTTDLTPLQHGLSQHACIVVEKDNKKWIVVTGGYMVDGKKPRTYLKTSQMFDLHDNRWETLGDLQTERHGHEMIFTEKGILLVGGLEGRMKGLRSVEQFEWKTKKWTTARRNLIKARNYFGLLEISAFKFDCSLDNGELECPAVPVKENGNWTCDPDKKSCLLKCFSGFVSLYTTTTCVGGTWKGINKMKCLPSVFFIAGGRGATKNIEFYHPTDGNLTCFNAPEKLKLEWYFHKTFIHQNTVYLCDGARMSICISTVHEDNTWKTHILSPRISFHTTIIIKDILYFVGERTMYATLPLNEEPLLRAVPDLKNTYYAPCVIKMGQDSFVIIGAKEDHGGVDEVKADVMKFDVSDNTSTILAPLQLKRYFHTCAIVEKENNEWIIVTGGLTPKKSGFNTITETTEIYDTRKNSWESLGKLNRRRWAHEMIVSERGVMVIGGNTHNPYVNPIRSVELLDWVTRQWIQIQPSLMEKRAYFGGAVEIPISLFGCQTHTKNLKECAGDYEHNKEYTGGSVVNVPESETCHSVCQKMENCVTWTVTEAKQCRVQTSLGPVQSKTGSISGKKNNCKPKCYLISDGQDVVKTNTEFCNEKNTVTECKKMTQMEATYFEKQQHEGRILICFEVEGEKVCEHIKYDDVDLVCSDEPPIVTLNTFKRINKHKYYGHNGPKLTQRLYE